MANFEFDGYKRKRKRTVIPETHYDKLEKLFQRETWPNRAKKEALAQEIGQSEHFVSVWFQNRRARMKREDGHSQGYKLMDSRNFVYGGLDKHSGLVGVVKGDGPSQLSPTKLEFSHDVKPKSPMKLFIKSKDYRVSKDMAELRPLKIVSHLEVNKCLTILKTV